MTTSGRDGVAAALETALANTFVFYFKAHSFHWNVTGPRFSQLHSFFGDIYEDAHEAVDDLAERMRTLKIEAPPSLEEITECAAIKCPESVPDADEMVSQLHSDNQTLIGALQRANKAADRAGNAGLANFLQDRIDKHEKLGWMLASTMSSKAPARRRGEPRYPRIAKDYVS